MFLLVTGAEVDYDTHWIRYEEQSTQITLFHSLQKILSHGWYSWGVWETWWKSPMQTGQFLLVTDTLKQVRREVLKKSSHPSEYRWRIVFAMTNLFDIILLSYTYDPHNRLQLTSFLLQGVSKKTEFSRNQLWEIFFWLVRNPFGIYWQIHVKQWI